MLKKKNIYHLFLFLLVLVSSLVSFSSGEAKEPENAGQPLLSLKYENGLVSVEAKDASLEKALRALGQRTGAKFITLTPVISDEVFSVSFSGLTFSEAVARLLKRFNYALMYENDNTARVIILDSKGVEPGKTGPGEYVREISREPTPAEKTALPAETKRRDTIDIRAMEPIRLSSPAEECPEFVFPGVDESGKSLINQSSIEQIKKIIGMNQCSHLWDQTLTILADIQDGRITALLIDLAKNGETVGLRMKATEVLWRNTAKSEFTNSNGIDALRMLASSSSEEGVRNMATRAVEDYQRYKSRIQSTEKRSSGDR